MNSVLDQERYDVSGKELGELVPAFTHDLYNDESRSISFYDSMLVKGLNFRKKSNVPTDFTIFEEKQYGETYPSNMPNQSFQYEFPGEGQMFDPVKMYMTGQANYDKIMSGGSLQVSQRRPAMRQR